MLSIRNIRKTYQTGDLVQTALDGVSLNLRDSEFVAVLGPSGSGKTTLLNIIGGLDRYDEGDLIINNVSTRNYKDRDWDTYRNHTIGFVFQSYNLIPHQNILSNVELALTIAGIPAKERKERALKALEEVGLKEQAHKRPNQLSGGQMQRVAIARALVNDPDILLADEPTGALDSKTSVQVMELLKEVAEDRLVVMVTHNPELADTYASRIVNLRDGKIVSDSNPFEPEDVPLEEHPPKIRKARMSYLTALFLSFHNLLTKKGRTLLTAFAGSIGIIGIALILSLSTGFQNYIDKIQEDTLSSYPLTITSETADATSAILSMVSDRENNPVEGDRVRERQYMTTMFSSIVTNDLRSLKHYLETHPEEYAKDVSHIAYSYSVKPLIYTVDTAGNIARLNPSSIMSGIYSSSAVSFMSSFSTGGNNIFSEISDNPDFYLDQYDVLAGRWPEKYDELILVLSEPNSISDLLVYSLGLRDTSELRSIMNNVMAGEESGVDNEPLEFTYEELMDLDLRLIQASELYQYNVKYDVYEDMSSDDDYMHKVYDRSLCLHIVGIVCAKEDSSSLILSNGVGYTRALTEYIVSEAQTSSIVRRQLSDRNTDVFSGNSFDEENTQDDRIDFNDMVSIDEDMIKDAFHFNIDQDAFKFDTLTEKQMQQIVMDSAQTAADMIEEVPDSRILAGMFALIDSQYVDSKVQAYEAMEGIVETTEDEEGNTSSYLLLEEEKLQEIRSSMTAADYRSFAKQIVQAIPETGEYAGLLEIFTDAQYTSLANDAAKMFDSYYNAVEAVSEDGKVNYYADETTVNYGDGTVPVTKNLILSGVIADPQNLSETNSVTNDVINSFVVSMIAAQIGNATAQMMAPMAESLSSLSEAFSGEIVTVDTDKFAQAFRFNMDEEELSRLMETMLNGTEEKSYNGNLISLGYQDPDDPTSISFYFRDFDGKENFLKFLSSYNEKADEDTKIRYTDITGILMSSVKTIVDVVTYVLIAFVSISLVVSSIMIAVITLISVMERTKEIGILRAMGASKHNVSSIFSAETFIIGLLSGLLGVGVTAALIPLINTLIHNLTGNYEVNAVLPLPAAVVLVIIAVLLTILAGLIPSRKAARQDPVIALRTE